MGTRSGSVRQKRGASCFLLLFCCAFGALAFDLQGHRGARGDRPENTLAAFEHALEIGVNTLELDVAITADGVPVISHDPYLNPALTRDAQGQWLKARGPLIRSLTLAQLQVYDVGRADPASEVARQFPLQQARDGQRIPTLASLFQSVGATGTQQVRFNIETKIFPNQPADTATPDNFVDAVLAVVRAAGLTSRVTIQSFDWRTLRRLQQLEPRIATVYLTVELPQSNNVQDPAWTAGMFSKDYASTPHMVKASGGAVWSPHFATIDANKVRAAQQLGLKVIPWTVNEPADMERLIGWGIDGLISDYPARARDVMRRFGLPLPASSQR
ncbi:MAG: glycerophosphodiester phosphodiesterase [Rhodoferax sp.]|nr:glycerophosphodiester phosphodiesterase [Rhodoferax sp.]